MKNKDKKIVFISIVVLSVIFMLVSTTFASLADTREIEILSTEENVYAENNKIKATRSIIEGESTDREIVLETNLFNLQRNVVDGGEVGTGAIEGDVEVVIAIDNSYSMTSTNDSDRLTKAKNAAKKIVSALSSKENVKCALVTSAEGKVISMGKYTDEMISKINALTISENKNSSISMLQNVETFYSEQTTNKFAYIITDGTDFLDGELENMDVLGIKTRTILTDITSQSYQILDSIGTGRIYKYDDFIYKLGEALYEILGEQSNTAEVAILVDNSSNISGTASFNNIKESAKKLVSELFTSVGNLKISLYNFKGEVKAFGTTEEEIVAAIDAMSKNGTKTLNNALTSTNDAFTGLTNNKFIVVFTSGRDGSKSVIQEVANTGVYLVAALTDDSVVSEGFGTEEEPTTGVVKYIKDNEINTLVDSIMEKINTYLHNDINKISVIEKFDSRIADNFILELVSIPDGTTVKQDGNKGYNWSIPSLTAQANISLKYKLKLKDNVESFNRNLMDLPIGISQSYGLTYTDETTGSGSLQLESNPKIQIVETYKIFVQAVKEYNIEENIKNVRFEVIGTNSKGEEIINKLAYVNEDGLLEIDGIKENGDITLKIRQTRVPDGFRREEETKTVVVNKNYDTGVITCKSEDDNLVLEADTSNKTATIGVKTFETAYITLYDENKSTGTNIAGSYWELTQPEGKPVLSARAQYYYSWSSGYRYTYYGGAKFEGDKLAAGEYTYKVKQTEAAAGYEPTSDFDVKITYNKSGEIIKAEAVGNEDVEAIVVDTSHVKIVVKSTLTADKNSTNFDIELNKFDADDNSKRLSGAQYSIDVEPEIVGNTVYRKETDENGKIYIENVYGTGETRIEYKETAAPSGYGTDGATKVVTIKVDPETKELSIVQDRTTIGIDVSIQGKKVVINETNAKILVENIIRINAKDNKDNNIGIAGIEYKLICPNGDELTAKTDNSGITDIADIEAPGVGTFLYYIEQKTIANGYEAFTEKVPVNITFDEDRAISKVEKLTENSNVKVQVLSEKIDYNEISKIADISIIQTRIENFAKVPFVLTKTDEETGKPIKGASFKVVYDAVNGETHTIRTIKKSTDANGKIELDIQDGEQINVKVQEMKPADGYIANNELHEFNLNEDENGNKVLSGNTKNVILDESNALKFNITNKKKPLIRKTNTTFEITNVSTDGFLLKDSELVLKEINTGTKWQLKTDENGIARISTEELLGTLPNFYTEKVGRYEFWIEELKVQDGYQLLEYSVGFEMYYEINGDENIEVTTMNVLDGQSYSCIMDQEYSQTYKDDYLDVYVKLKLVNTPEQVPVELKNTIKITKVDADNTSRVIPNTEFDILVKNADGGSIKAHKTTDKYGKIVLDNLKFLDGKTTIEITETAAAPSYMLDSTTKVYEVSSVNGSMSMISGQANINGREIDITLTNKKGLDSFNMVLTKEDAYDSSIKLGNAQFTVKVTADDVTTVYEKVTTNTIYNWGKAFINGITKTGNILVEIQETKAPSGYILDSTVRKFGFYRNPQNGNITIDVTKFENIERDDVSVENNNVKVTLRNTPDAMLSIHKINAENGASISGVNFNITVPTEDGSIVRNVQTEYGFASVILKNGISGRYEIEEVKAPSGYAPIKKFALDIVFNEDNEPVEVNLVKGLGEEYEDSIEGINVRGKKITLTITNQKLDSVPTYSVRIDKVDSKDRDRLLLYAGFSINIEQEEGPSLSLNKSTGKTGKIYVNGLTGTGNIKLEIEETTAPSGYKLNDQKQVISLTRNPETQEITLDTSKLTGIDAKDVIIDNEKHIIAITIENVLQDSLIIENQNIENENYKIVNTIYSITRLEEGVPVGGSSCKTGSDGIAITHLGDNLKGKEVVYNIHTSEIIGYYTNNDVKLKINYDENGKIQSAEIIEGATDDTEVLISNIDESVPYVGGDAIKVIIRNKKIVYEPTQGETVKPYEPDPGSFPDIPAPDPLYPTHKPEDIPNLTYSIELEKVDRYNDRIKVANAKYGIYVYNEETGMQTSYIGITNKQGKILVTGLTGYGKNIIEIVEIKEPSDYELDTEKKTVTITRDMLSQYLQIIDEETSNDVVAKADNINKVIKVKLNERQKEGKFTIALSKNDLEDETINLRNTKFLLTDLENGNEYNLVTNEYGIANVSITKKADGEHKFTIKETEAPQGYTLDEEIKTLTLTFLNGKIQNATVDSGDVSNLQEAYVEVNLLNGKVKEGTPYSIELIKSDAYYTSITFPNALIKLDVSNQYGQSDITKTALTNANGRIYINDIYGSGNIDINITELEPPAGRRFDTKVKEVHISKDTETGWLRLEKGTSNVDTYVDNTNKKIIIRIRNYEDYGGFTVGLNKVDSEDQNLSLMGAEFTMQLDGSDEKVVLNQYNNGIIAATNIPMPKVEDEGTFTYTIKETKAPYGYMLNEEDTKLSITIKKVNDLQVITDAAVISGRGEVKIHAEQFLHLVIENTATEKRDPYTVKVRKIDSNDNEVGIGNTLIGVTVKAESGEQYYKEIYTDSEGYINLNNITGTGKIIVGLEELKSAEGYSLVFGYRTIAFYRNPVTKEITYLNSETDDIGIKSENVDGKINAVISIKNSVDLFNNFSLHLEKFASSIDGIEPEGREPVVITNESGTIRYQADETPLRAEKGQKVIYTFRVYNQGNINGYAQKISDTLPEGLLYIAESEINSKYGWTLNEETGKLETDYLSKEKDINNEITGFKAGLESPNYKDVQIELLIDENTDVESIVNIGKIEKQIDSEGNEKNPSGVLDNTTDSEYITLKEEEETISIELTKNWVDNNIQSLRRPDEIKFVVTQYREVSEDVISESEEVISNENEITNENIKENEQIEESDKTEESNINNVDNEQEIEENTDIENTIEENVQNSTKIDEEKVVLENAYSNELQKSRIVNELSESIVPKKLDTEFKNIDSNQEEYDSNVNEETSEIQQDNNSKLEQEETTQDSKQKELEENIIDSNPNEDSQITDETQNDENANQTDSENEDIINIEDLPVEGAEKVEITTYEYTFKVDKNVNQQIFTLEGLPKYDKETAEEIKYVITEKEVNEGDLRFYETAVGEVKQETDEEGNIKYIAEITNTFKLPENNTQNITAIKDWNDNGKIATRPTSLILELIGRVQNIELPAEYKDISSKEQSISSTNNWRNTFTSIPIYDENGQEIEYTLQEKAEEGILDKYIAEIGEINEANEIVITNNLIIHDSKIIKDGDKEIHAVDSKVSYNFGYDIELDDRYTENATIEIVDTLPYQIDVEKSNLNGGVYNYNEESNIATITWRGIYNSVDKTITFENSSENILVEILENETTNSQYISIIVDFDVTYKDVQILTDKIINRISGTVTLANNVSETVENSFETETRWIKDVVVNKLWKGDTIETRPDSITAELKANDSTLSLENTAATITPTTNEAGTQEWTHTWNELPTYDTDGNEIKYTVDETSINYTKGDQSVENKYYCEQEEEFVDGKTIVTLTNIKYGSITVEKVDSRNSDNKLQGAEFKLEKMIQTEEGEWIVPDTTSEDYLAYTGTTGEDGTYTFEELKYGHYKLTETEAPEDYKIGEKDIEAIEINEETSDVEVQISNIRVYKLPITGGIGVDTIRNIEILSGIILLILITNRKKVVPSQRSKVEARKIKNLEKLAKMHNRK